jgi:hypothetical protein
VLYIPSTQNTRSTASGYKKYKTQIKVYILFIIRNVFLDKRYFERFINLFHNSPFGIW